MSMMQPHETLRQFLKEYSVIYTEAARLTDDEAVLEKIYKNIHLFQVYNSIDCVKHYGMAADVIAPSSEHTAQPNTTTIYFNDIGLYGSFSESQYAKFRKAIEEYKKFAPRLVLSDNILTFYPAIECARGGGFMSMFADGKQDKYITYADLIVANTQATGRGRTLINFLLDIHNL
jgi:hypothetical protein